MASEQLNAKQQLFADTYLANKFNGKQAAIAAGYSAKTAEVTASQLLRMPKVKAYMDQKKKKVIAKLEITQQRTLKEMGRLAYSDIRRMYNADGTLKGIHEMDDDIAAAISRVETEEKKVKGKIVSRITKVYLWGKDRPLENLAKHFHIFEEVAPVVVEKPIDITKLSTAELKVLLALKQKAKK